jgi:hypothetical protein
MPTVTVKRSGRRWLILPAYSVSIVDPTGAITFSGYSRVEAIALAITLRPMMGNRPVGPLAQIMAKELTLREPKPGEKWTHQF